MTNVAEYNNVYVLDIDFFEQLNDLRIGYNDIYEKKTESARFFINRKNTLANLIPNQPDDEPTGKGEIIEIHFDPIYNNTAKDQKGDVSMINTLVITVVVAVEITNKFFWYEYSKKTSVDFDKYFHYTKIVNLNNLYSERYLKEKILNAKITLSNYNMSESYIMGKQNHPFFDECVLNSPSSKELIVKFEKSQIAALIKTNSLKQSEEAIYETNYLNVTTIIIDRYLGDNKTKKFMNVPGSGTVYEVAKEVDPITGMVKKIYKPLTSKSESDAVEERKRLVAEYEKDKKEREEYLRSKNMSIQTDKMIKNRGITIDDNVIVEDSVTNGINDQIENLVNDINSILENLPTEKTDLECGTKLELNNNLVEANDNLNNVVEFKESKPEIELNNDLNNNININEIIDNDKLCDNELFEGKSIFEQLETTKFNEDEIQPTNMFKEELQKKIIFNELINENLANQIKDSFKNN